MRKRIAYCVSGHGLGHAGRAVAIVQALTARRHDLEVCICSDAPRFMFAEVLGPRVTLHLGLPEPGMAEVDALTIDVPGTIGRLRDACAGHGERVERVTAQLHALQADLILADIPYLAGYAAERLELPCVGVSNFTWDWIYEPLLAGVPDAPELLEMVRGGYRRMAALVRLPISGHSEVFPQVLDAGFVARNPGRSRAELVKAAGLDPSDPRPRILPALRGAGTGILERAAKQNPDFLFLSQSPAPHAPANMLAPDPNAHLTFDELLQLSDAVVSKPGWGIFNDCVVHGKALLYVPRTGFREDALSLQQMPRLLRMQELSRTAYEAGDWGPALASLLTQPAPTEAAPADGATQTGAFLDRWL